MKSQAQRAYLHINEPEVAKKFEAETPKGKKLPYKKIKKNVKKITGGKRVKRNVK